MLSAQHDGPWYGIGDVSDGGARRHVEAHRRGHTLYIEIALRGLWLLLAIRRPGLKRVIVRRRVQVKLKAVE